MTADDLESAVDTLKRRGENIVEIDYLKDFMNLRQLSLPSLPVSVKNIG